MVAPIDMTGQRFGRLVAIRRIGHTAGHARWLWKCDCGAEKEALSTNVKTGQISSCGCFNLENITKHGYAGTRTYLAWQHMKSRAAGNGEMAKKYYVDRGIIVCDRWDGSFDLFLCDMGECPDGLELDRIDNDGNYEPRNCRWASRSTQMANTRRTHRVTLSGEIMCLAHACKRIGLNYRTAMKRMSRGMSPQQAIEA